jgi:hypothetical protein
MTYNRSFVDNLISIKIEETLLNLFLKKFHNLRHIIQYLTLVKKYLRFHNIIFEMLHSFFLCTPNLRCKDYYFSKKYFFMEVNTK